MITNPYRNQPPPISTTPIHWWNMDNLTTGIDDQGTGGTGSPWPRLTNTNVTSESGPQPAPNGGDSLYFSGSDYLNRSAVGWTGSDNDWSVSLWFNARNGFASGGFGTMIGWHDSVASGNGGIFWIREAYNPNTAYSLAIDGDWQSIQTQSNVPGHLLINTWYHVVTTWNNATNTVSQYINNGNLTTATDINVQDLPPSSTPLPFAIGAQANNLNSKFEGNLWAMGIFDAVLTADDISALYNGGSGLQYNGSTWS